MCHFQPFWVGSKPIKRKFFEIFEAKEQKEKTVKYRKKSKNFGEISEIIGKIGKNRTKEFSVEISFRSPSIADISIEIS